MSLPIIGGSGKTAGDVTGITSLQFGTTPFPTSGDIRVGGGAVNNVLVWKRTDSGAQPVGIATDPGNGATQLFLGCDTSFANGCNVVRIYPAGSGILGTGSTNYLTWGSSTVDSLVTHRFIDGSHQAGTSGYSKLQSVSGSLYFVTAASVVQSVGSARISRAFPTDANYTAAQADYVANIMEFTGTISATRNVVVPILSGYTWIVYNNTTASFSIQVIGATGTGVTIAYGKRATVYADGTNIVRATADV